MTTGSLQIRNGKYYTVLNIHQGGKRKQVWKTTGLSVKGNKTRASRILQERIKEADKKELESLKAADPNNMPFTSAVKLWQAWAERHVDAVTAQGYRNLIDVHIIPYFESMALSLRAIDKTVLQDYFDAKAKNGRKDGKGGLSARTLRLHKNILFQTLKWAVGEGLIPSNPCEHVELPAVERYEAHFYAQSQVIALLSAIKEEPLYPIVKVTVVYGLRRSEVLGLKWDCIDFENNAIYIRRTVVKVTETVEKDKTKNQASRRAYPLTQEIKDLFLDLRRKQAEERKMFGKSYIDCGGYIFRWPDGRAFSPDYVSKKFKSLLEAHNLPLIRFHELRHSSASNLLSMGFTLKDVQEWLGHSDIRVTANIYGHLDLQRKKMLASAMSEHFTEGKSAESPEK